MRIIETKVYQIDEHPNKEACYEWIRNNWHNLSQHLIDDVVEVMKSIQKVIGGDMDYGISAVPDRGEFITWTDFDKKALKAIKGTECNITGMCYEYDVIKALKNDNLHLILKMVHDENDYIYSDEALEEMCQANMYEFDEDGKIA